MCGCVGVGVRKLQANNKGWYNSALNLKGCLTNFHRLNTAGIFEVSPLRPVCFHIILELL